MTNRYRTRFLKFIVALVLVSFVGCPIDDLGHAKWQLFESKEDNFKVLLPNPPTRKVDGSENIYISLYYDGKRVLQVIRNSESDPSIPLMDRVKSVETLPGVRGPVKATAISLGRHQGIEATYEMPEGTASVLKHRMYYVDKMLYQLIVVMTKADYSESDVEKFFSSFQLLSD